MGNSDQIILGIDPGSQVTGYGIIRVTSGKLLPIDFGCIRPTKATSSADAYRIIFQGIDALIHLHQPTAISIETQFVYKNIQSALKLGMARSAGMLPGALRNIPIHEYAPKKAKCAVVGNGNASKEQVQKMIQILLQLTSPPQPEDAADALALAICHAHTLKRS